MNCIFCKIADGGATAQKVYEDTHFIAFLDINPRSKGHALVIPKKHYATVLDMPDDELSGLFLVARMVAERSIRNLGARGFNICVNSGRDAGQVVPHAHVHVIPRYGEEEGAIESAFPVRPELAKNMEEVAMLLQSK